MNHQTKQKDYCPGCGQLVATYEPGRGGTQTDSNEERWHRSCVVGQSKKKT